MNELTISEVVRHPSKLREALAKGPVRITWRESKPKGRKLFSAIIRKEE